MTNLVEEFGQEGFMDKFSGSFFLAEGGVCSVRSVNRRENTVAVRKFSGPVYRVARENISLPFSFFKDMSTFAMPELGWRSAYKGKYLVYYSRNNRSYHKGISLSNLVTERSPLTNWLSNKNEIDVEYFAREHTVATLLTSPATLTLAEGLKKINDGSIMSFCINSNMAVMPIDEDELALMFGTKQVGTVGYDGRVQCSVPFVMNVLENGNG